MCLYLFLPALKTHKPQLSTIEAAEAELVFPHFTADDAWTLGLAIRENLRRTSEKPVVIDITLANNNQVLFHTATRSGTQPDNDIWVARKRKTVLRWGVSSYYMHEKMMGNEGKFRDKYALGDRAGEYAIHGGGVPVKVKGVEGVVAVVVVSGLTQEEDHNAVVEQMSRLIQEMKSDTGR